MTDQLRRLTAAAASIVSAYVTAHRVSAADVPAMIAAVYAALKPAPEPERSETIVLTPAQIRKSITPLALISFVDGKSYKTLKRHLGRHGLTLDDYRTKYGLPDDYPSTAPAYSEKRSAMARGRRPRPVWTRKKP